MKQQSEVRTLVHPLEMVPFFRRWPSSTKRNVVYTVIWSTGMAFVMTFLGLRVGPRGGSLLEHLLPMILMSNLIGGMIHLCTVVFNLLLDGWPRRARGLPRMLYSIAVMAFSMVFGVGVGNLILRGANPFTLLTNSEALVQLMVIAVGIALLLYVVRLAADRRIAREVEDARQKEFVASAGRLLAEAKLRALQAQIEPHFLYNTLANVVSLIGPHPAQAQHMLERFIDYLRASLAASRSERATLASEAKLIAAYLDVLKVRMGDRLRYRIDVPDALSQFSIAPMLLQPVVENAISHGLEPKVEGGEIVLSAHADGAHLWVQISDTGVGLNEAAPAKPGGGVGLSNLRERLRSLYAGQARVELLENQPCGMTVRLMLPLNASPTSIPSVP
jgi:sensor histidine kinase YesM